MSLRRLVFLIIAIHTAAWLTMLLARKPVPREYLQREPTRAVKSDHGTSMEMSLTSDTGILLFDRAYGGWGSDGVLSKLLVLLDLPTIIVASVLTGIADFALPWNEHILSVLAGTVVLIVGPLQWVGIAALLRRAAVNRRHAGAPAYRI